MPTRSKQVKDYVDNLGLIKQIRDRIAEIEKLKKEKKSEIQRLESERDEEISKLEQQKQSDLEELEKKKDDEIKKLQQGKTEVSDKIRRSKDEAENKKFRLEQEKKHLESENDTLSNRISSAEENKESIEQEIQRLQEQLNMDIVVNGEQLKSQIGIIQNRYTDKIEEARCERDKLIELLNRKKLKLKKVKEEIDAIDAEQICNSSSLNLDEMLKECRLFDSDKDYLKRITGSNWASLGIPIILGVLILGLFVAGAFIFNWGFLNLAAKGIASFIWWIVEAAFLALASWLLGHFFALFSDAKKIPIIISIVASLIINHFWIIPASVFIAYVLSIIYSSIIDENYWDMDESGALPCVSFGIILLLEIIWLHDTAFAWMNNKSCKETA